MDGKIVKNDSNTDQYSSMHLHQSPGAERVAAVGARVVQPLPAGRRRRCAAPALLHDRDGEALALPASPDMPSPTTRTCFTSLSIAGSIGRHPFLARHYQGLPSRPVRPNRRCSVPVYRSGLAGYRSERSNSNLNSNFPVQPVRTGIPVG